MLPLQLKLFIPKRFLFLSKLIFLSFIGHLLLFLCSVIVINKKEKLIIPLHLHDAPIVVLPFVKTVGKISGAQIGSSVGGPGTKTQTTFIEKAPKKAKAKPAKKAPQKKGAKAKPEAPKKSTPTKAEPIKVEPVKKAAQEAAPMPVQSLPEAQALTLQQGDQAALVIGREDAILFTLITELKNDIEQSWERPAGLPTTVLYTVHLAIDNEGNVTIQNEESSGALALDITARSFLMSYNFPQRVWGREIELML